MRKGVWLYMSGASSRMHNAGPSYYQKLCGNVAPEVLKDTKSESKDVSQIALVKCLHCHLYALLSAIIKYHFTIRISQGHFPSTSGSKVQKDNNRYTESCLQ